MSLPEKLIKSAKTGNSRDVRKLLGRGVQITKDKFGNTALHEAAWNGHRDIVKALLNAFCIVNSINNSGFTPLHLASQCGHGKTVKTLLKWRADPTLLNQHGETALHLAAKYNHSTVISVFASFKVNINIRGKDSNTPLHIAARLGNTEAIKALLRGGASPHLANVRGARPVEYAEISGFKSAIKILSSKMKMRTRSVTDSRTPTPTDKLESRGGSPLEPVHSSPRLQRANSVSAKFNFRSTHKKQNSVHSGLTSTVQMADDGSPPNTYAEIGEGPEEISARGPPTIDQLLTEIEQECNGPDYKFSPLGGSRGPSEVAWVYNPYSSSSSSPHHRKAASFDGSDTQTGRGGVSFEATPTTDYLPPHEMRAVENAVERTFQVYETIPFQQSPDDDTYVYMAPCRDVQSNSPQLSQSSQDTGTSDSRSKIPKRAIICSSPIVPDQRHEPNVTLTPAKGILSQPSSPQQSEIDRYLQGELETMRQAFQIRLAQLEKRYQRQLRMEQQRNTTSGGGGATMSIPIDVHQKRRSLRLSRRSSWHSCVSDSDTEDPEPEQIQRCGSSQGFDSDCNGESDYELIDQSDERFKSHDPYSGRGSQGTSKPLQRALSLDVNHTARSNIEGLKGGSRTWNVEPGNGARARPGASPVQNPVREEAIVNEGVSEHRERILQYFQQVSEAKIAAIERQYEAHISQVETCYQTQATTKLSQLETRVKDLEKKLDFETLV